MMIGCIVNAFNKNNGKRTMPVCYYINKFQFPFQDEVTSFTAPPPACCAHAHEQKRKRAEKRIEPVCLEVHSTMRQ